MFTISGLEIGNLSSRSHVVPAPAFLVVDRMRTVAKCTKIEMVGQRLQKCIFFIVFTLKIWKIVTFLWVTVVTAIVVVCVSIQFIAQYQEKNRWPGPAQSLVKSC